MEILQKIPPPAALKFETLLPVTNLISVPISAIYVAIVVLVLNFSNHKEVTGLKKIMFVYNIIAAVLSTFTAAVFVYTVITNGANQPLYIFAMQVYWLSKIFEMLDTVFMLLRRKYDQVSLLHVYHHSSMAIVTEWFYKIHPVTQASVPSGLNSIVHIVMYSYYALAAIEVSCPWKKYITQFQLTQFFLLVIHGTVGGWITGDPHYYFYIIYEISMIFYFLPFYWKTYNKRPARDPKGNSKKDK